MPEKIAAPKKYDFRDSNFGTVIPIETSTGQYYLEKVEHNEHGTALDNWRVHTTMAMGETTVQLINLIPNPYGQPTWSPRADMKEQGGLGYIDQGVVHDLGKIGAILDSFTIQESKVIDHVKAA